MPTWGRIHGGVYTRGRGIWAGNPTEGRETWRGIPQLGQQDKERDILEGRGTSPWRAEGPVGELPTQGQRDEGVHPH